MAARKKAKPKKKKVGPPRYFIVRLKANDQGVNRKVRTSRKRRDLVKWVNDSTKERRLQFENKVWPFEGTLCDIVVPLHGESGWYRVTKHAGDKGVIKYKYLSSPSFDPGAPPGDPVVDTGD